MLKLRTDVTERREPRRTTTSPSRRGPSAFRAPSVPIFRRRAGRTRPPRSSSSSFRRGGSDRHTLTIRSARAHASSARGVRAEGFSEPASVEIPASTKAMYRRACAVPPPATGSVLRRWCEPSAAQPIPRYSPSLQYRRWWRHSRPVLCPVRHLVPLETGRSSTSSAAKCGRPARRRRVRWKGLPRLPGCRAASQARRSTRVDVRYSRAHRFASVSSQSARLPGVP